MSNNNEAMRKRIVKKQISEGNLVRLYGYSLTELPVR